MRLNNLWEDPETLLEWFCVIRLVKNYYVTRESEKKKEDNRTKIREEVKKEVTWGGPASDAIICN